MGKDQLTKARRSWNMSRIRGRDTAPEMRVRSLLHRMGYRFRLHVRIPVPYLKPSPPTNPSSNNPTPPRPRSRPSPPRPGRGIKGEVSTPAHNPNPNRRPKSPLTTHNSQLTTFFVRPDIVLPKYKTAIFVHGCFWHRHQGCKNCTTPTNRREFWVTKLEGNAVRDILHRSALRKLGWRSLVVWECQIEKPKSIERFRKVVKRTLQFTPQSGR